MLSSSSSTRFGIGDSFPWTSGLHLIGACHVYQVDHIIQAQQSKRRGGPKKALLQYKIVDSRQITPGVAPSASLHEVEWKTITQKNFSNKANITQYERGTFGTLICPSHMLVMHGARSGKKGSSISNTVGVNVSGKVLSQHPRFLLSSGKGEVGARSTLLFYSTQPYARVEFQRMAIEHRELKITIEQLDEDELDVITAPLVGFAPKYKQVYAQRSADGDSAAASSYPSLSSSVSAPSPLVKRSTSKWSSASELSRDTSLVSTSTINTTPMPPVKMPPTILARIAKRKRLDIIDSPVSEQACKKEKSTDSDASSSFSGFESGFDDSSIPLFLLPSHPLLDFDEPMTDLGTDSEEDSMDYATPRMATTPPPLESPTPAEAQITFNEHEMLMFEQSLEKYGEVKQPADFIPLPTELATAHLLSGNPFAFTHASSFGPSCGASLPHNSLAPLLAYPACSPPPALFELDSAMRCQQQQQQPQSHAAKCSNPPSSFPPPPIPPHPSHLANPYAHLFPSMPPTLTLTTLRRLDPDPGRRLATPTHAHHAHTHKPD